MALKDPLLVALDMAALASFAALRPGVFFA